MDFRDLHYGETPLLLPNAWDVGSAVAFADQGFRAVGTTSFGVGAAAGYADGARASKAQTTRLVWALSGLAVYVSADIEDGYSDEPGEVADYVDALGADGVNIEDSTGEALISPDRHAAKIAEIKRQVPGVFVNARVDNYWLGQDAEVPAVLERAAAYVAAGADGIFVPGVTSPAELEALAAAIPVPLNVLVVPALTVEDLGRLGVRRVSTGSLPYRAAVDAAVEVALAVRDGRTPAAATPYPEAQARVSKYASLVTGESTKASREATREKERSRFSGALAGAAGLPARVTRYFEDYLPGLAVDCGSFSLSEAEIIAFAKEYDPQPFHVDPEGAKTGPFGGLIASGWHTLSRMMRQLVEYYVSPESSLGAAGLEEIRWLRPVRPGDTLQVTATVLETRRSASKPDRGIVKSRLELTGADGGLAGEMTSANFVLLRDPSA